MEKTKAQLELEIRTLKRKNLKLKGALKKMCNVGIGFSVYTIISIILLAVLLW